MIPHVTHIWYSTEAESVNTDSVVQGMLMDFECSFLEKKACCTIFYFENNLSVEASYLKLI